MRVFERGVSFELFGAGVEFELVGFLKILGDAETHEMVGDFYRDGPLWIVDVWEMLVFFGEQLNFFENFFVVELVIVPTFEVQPPAFNLLRNSMLV